MRCTTPRRQGPGSRSPRDLRSKVIEKAKLLLTTRCNLGCPYCFVKDTGQDMDPALARSAVDLLVESEGRHKLVSLFGGEPLLRFDLVEEICPYARRRAAENGKELILSIITSASVLTARHCEFFAEQGVRMAVSLAGERADTDAIRMFRGGRGSYDEVVRRLPHAFAAMPRCDVGVSFAVRPASVARLHRNFRHLLELGFRYVNFEIILDFEPWEFKHVEVFLEQAEKVFADALASVETGDPVYLNTINWEFARGRLTEETDVGCPFHYLLKVYPGGELAFSHSVMSLPEHDRWVFGNLRTGELREYADCSFDPASELCRGCVREYFEGYALDRGAALAHQALAELTRAAVGRIDERAGGKDARWAAYRDAMKAEVLF